MVETVCRGNGWLIEVAEVLLIDDGRHYFTVQWHNLVVYCFIRFYRVSIVD